MSNFSKLDTKQTNTVQNQYAKYSLDLKYLFKSHTFLFGLLCPISFCNSVSTTNSVILQCFLIEGFQGNFSFPYCCSWSGFILWGYIALLSFVKLENENRGCCIESDKRNEATDGDFSSLYSTATVNHTLLQLSLKYSQYLCTTATVVPL